MSRVLIWKRFEPGSEYDIYRGMDCRREYQWRTNFNVGNRLWFQGLMSAIDTGENQYDFLQSEMTTEMINGMYDLIILPMANIFNSKFRNYLESLSFDGIRIPVYVIACGAQADSYDGLDRLVEEIGELSKRFIGSVYETGGEFALRGYFTKEFFTRLGFSSAVVTGCPSMYQLGRGFRAVSAPKDGSPALPVFNGEIPAVMDLMKHYPDSVYMDQDGMWENLYRAREGIPGLREELAFFCNYSQNHADLLGGDRVRLIPDMYNWSAYLKRTGFDYSFGTRIHGNIMAILSGIPATVAALDTRTREMAEFFSIPCVDYQPGHSYSPAELEALYRGADYTRFNQTYPEKYRAYEDFLIRHGIVTSTNQDNRFFGAEKEYVAPPPALNAGYYQTLAERMKRDRMLLRCLRAAVEFKGRLRSRRNG